MIFSHNDPRGIDGGPRSFTEIDRPLVLISGEFDNFLYSNIYDATRSIALRMRVELPGAAVFLRNTGHSVQAERPRWLANRIVDFTVDPS